MPATANKLTSIVEDYLSDLRRVRASGGATGERSTYGPLANLLNDIGATLRPKVFCVGELAQQGAGHPDFGLYAAKQLQRGKPRDGQLPECGVVEVKPPGRRRLANRRERSGQPLLAKVSARPRHQHPRLHSAGRGLPRKPRKAGDLPAGRLRRVVRVSVPAAPRIRPSGRPRTRRVPVPRPITPRHPR